MTSPFLSLSLSLPSTFFIHSSFHPLSFSSFSFPSFLFPFLPCGINAVYQCAEAGLGRGTGVRWACRLRRPATSTNLTG